MIGAVFVRNCKRGVGLLVGLAPFFNIQSEAPELGTTVFITEKTEISSVGESLRELKAKNKKLKKNHFFLSALAGNRSLKGIEGIKCMDVVFISFAHSIRSKST